ncbi:hypothetical protein NL676_017829 [Syzygium grande]|nr:hypothetical protein NL676_017829 [Syzygium grande]
MGRARGAEAGERVTVLRKLRMREGCRVGGRMTRRHVSRRGGEGVGPPRRGDVDGRAVTDFAPPCLPGDALFTLAGGAGAAASVSGP